MCDDQITVQSVTGVGLTLNIAGPGTRSYAFVIDWHIRLLLALAWLLIAVLGLKFTLKVRSTTALFTLLPAAILYFLYHPILEVLMRGRTPGKRMAGVRILNRTGGTPSTAALIIRNLFRLIDGLPLVYLVGLTSCFITTNRVRIGDMAAGTFLVLDDAAAEASLGRMEALSAHSSLPLDALELADQLKERWSALDPQKRSEIARALLIRLFPGTPSGEFGSLDDPQLRERIEALLGTGLEHG